MTSDDISNTAKDISASAADAASRARDSVGQAASDAGGRVGEAAAQAAGAARDVYDRARDTAAELGEHMPRSTGETLKAGQRAYSRGSDRVGRQVAKQPIEALLLAGAIGYLVGWAANRG